MFHDPYMVICVSPQVIVCVGGYKFWNLDCVETFDPATNKWISLEKLPFAVRSVHNC